MASSCEAAVLRLLKGVDDTVEFQAVMSFHQFECRKLVEYQRRNTETSDVLAPSALLPYRSLIRLIISVRQSRRYSQTLNAGRYSLLLR